MSDINFLDNAVQGKNSWVRYFLTIVISVDWRDICISTFYSTFHDNIFFKFGNFGLEVQMNILNYNPLLILVLVGISYGIYSLLFYLCIRFIHKKKFLSLINTGKNIKWNRILKGGRIMGGNNGDFHTYVL